MRVYFIDDRTNEILELWDLSGCESSHTLLPLEVFDSFEQTLSSVLEHKADVIVIGYGLGWGKPSGAEVIQHLRQNGYQGYVASNSGGGPGQFGMHDVDVDADVSRNPQKLSQVLTDLS